ncbi:hypothetical protein B0H19DRAFT_418571 [Mycena capillaripes]|nr:hypothetical protein B0H19DRAFT_418571 [Mycena capillaripes]
MFVIHSPALTDGQFGFVIARDDNHYYFMLAGEFYGHCPSRICKDMNASTAAEEPTFLPNGHPCIWVEPLEDYVFNLGKLLAITPRAPIRLSGRRKSIASAKGELGETKELVEIVIMLSEDELAHCCYYCGRPESMRANYADPPALREPYTDHWSRMGGNGYSSTYKCCDCLAERFFTRIRKRTRRNVRDW